MLSLFFGMGLVEGGSGLRDRLKTELVEYSVRWK